MPDVTFFDSIPDSKFLEELRKRIELPKHVLQRIGDYAHTIAWTIARTTDIRAMARIKRLLIDAIGTGASISEWMDSNYQLLLDIVGAGMTEAYAETIFRTTLGHVFEAVRFERLTQDKNVEWLIYDAINDDRVRPDHLALDGMAFPRNAFPPNLWPPNGYNCRCTVVPAYEHQLAELGAWTPQNLAGLPQPDAGFNAPPSLAGLSDIVKNDLQQTIDKAVRGILD